MASSGKSFEAKGKSGHHKRYFKGRYSKSNKRRHPSFEIPVGELIVFRVHSKILVGYVRRKTSNECYEVAFCESTSCKDYHSITAENEPKLVETLKMSLEDIKLMTNVLTVWDYSGGFLSLTPGKVIQIQANYIWVKPNQDVCRHAVRVNINDICANPYKNLQGRTEPTDDQINPSSLYIMSSVLKITQSELQTMYSLYSSTLKKLHARGEETKNLGVQLINLQNQYQMASSVVMQLRESLVNSQGLAASRANTLQQIVAEQKESIGRYQREVTLLSSELKELRDIVTTQSKRLTETTQQWNADRRELKKLQIENELLHSRVTTLSKTVQRDCNQREAIASKLMEVRPNTSACTSGTFIMTRQAGSTRRPTALLPVVLPEVAASQASSKSLENRAKQLGQVSQPIYLSSRTV